MGELSEFFCVVGVDEERENNSMHGVRFREGEGFSHQSRESLAQGAVEALDVICVGLGLTLRELVRRDNFGVSLPDVRETVRLLIRFWNGLPQFLASSLAASSNDKGHDLACAPTQRQPEPTRANQSQRLFLRRLTMLQISSNSNTSSAS